MQRLVEEEVKEFGGSAAGTSGYNRGRDDVKGVGFVQ
jgi:hypothetical protein